MQAFQARSKELDDRVCRGVGGENDERNRGFDDLRKHYDDAIATVADAAEEAAAAAADAAAAPVTPVARPPRPPSPEEPLFDAPAVLARLQAEGRTLCPVPLTRQERRLRARGDRARAHLPGVAPSPAPAGERGEATGMETEATLALALREVVVSPHRARAPPAPVSTPTAMSPTPWLQRRDDFEPAPRVMTPDEDPPSYNDEERARLLGLLTPGAVKKTGARSPPRTPPSAGGPVQPRESDTTKRGRH